MDISTFTPEQLALFTPEQLAVLTAVPKRETYPAAVANFNLIRSTNTTNPKAPNYFGSFKLNNQWYVVSAWNTVSKAGQPLINNSVRPATQAEAEKSEARDQQFQANAPIPALTPVAPVNPLTEEVTKAAEKGIEEIDITDPRHPDYAPF